MKVLFASTAIALGLAAPGFAQTAMPMEGGFVGGIENQALRASDLLGARLYVTEADVDLVGGLSPDWDDVGEISDIIVGGGGDIDAVLVDIGGFLGLGERTTAVDMDSLQFVSDGPDADDFFVVLTGNRAALEAAPEFDATFERGRTIGTRAVMNEGSGMDTQDGAATIVDGEPVADLDAGTVVDNPQTPATAVVTEGGQTVTTTTTDTDVAGATVDGETTMPGTTDPAVVVVDGDDGARDRRDDRDRDRRGERHRRRGRDHRRRGDGRGGRRGRCDRRGGGDDRRGGGRGGRRDDERADARP